MVSNKEDLVTVIIIAVLTVLVLYSAFLVIYLYFTTDADRVSCGCGYGEYVDIVMERVVCRNVTSGDIVRILDC